MRRELLHRLHQKGISETPPIVDLPPVERMIPVSRFFLQYQESPKPSSYYSNNDSLIFKLLLAGAFYPNVLTNQTHVDDREVGRDLQGCDPLNTCVVSI